jgi:hypothetical protein
MINTTKSFSFDPTINLGHVLTALTFLVVATTGYVALDARVGFLERSFREEQVRRVDGDNGVESRLVFRITEHRNAMDSSQLRVFEDIREIKAIVREGFRDLDAKLEKKAEKPRQ